MASTLSFRTFLLSFWCLPVLVVVFLVNDLLYFLIVSMTCQWKINLVVPSRYNPYALIQRSICLSLKAIEFNGVDTTGFLRNFVVLMYLFIFIDILRSY